MSRKLIVLTFIISIFIGGCFSSKNEETLDKPLQRDIVQEIIELTNSKNTRKTAAEVKDASNGLISGIYLKIGSVLYTYTFENIANFTALEKNDFLTLWNVAVENDSYIVYEDKAITLTTAKLIFETPGAKLSTAVSSGLNSSDEVFPIKPETLVVTYPLAVNSGIAVNADRKRGMVLVAAGTLPDIGNGQLVISSSFYISKYEVTQGEFESVMGFNPSYFKGTNVRNNPAEQITWYDAIMYCNKLSEREGLTPYYVIKDIIYNESAPELKNITSATITTSNLENATKGYRLPTSLEWEYAARGGISSRGYWYSGSNAIESTAWFFSNSNMTNANNPELGKGSCRVGTKLANELGIYDMNGNVWEWCSELTIGDDQIIRGGSWLNTEPTVNNCYKEECWKGTILSTIGFRPVRTF